MKRSTTRLLAASALAGLGLIGLATVSLADGGDYRRWRMHDGERHGMGGYGMGRHGGMYEMMLGFDTNGDGKLSQEEIDQGRANQLKEFDTDGDGTLNLGEYQALWLSVMRERMVDRFQEHDADGDGKVTVEEFGKRFAHMVKYMDSNGDGVIDESDMQRRHHRDREDDDN